MSDTPQEGNAEIVIVRRRGTDDGTTGKGGAWKIAYADFVTAMMAFFLVMWLINAANEETRAQVASYFNPIKLTDSTTGSKSLRDTKEQRNSTGAKTALSKDSKNASQEEMIEEARMMVNPTVALKRIAQQNTNAFDDDGSHKDSDDASPSSTRVPENPGVGDPFDPRTWERLKEKNELPQSEGITADQPPTAVPVEATKVASARAMAEDATSIKRDLAGKLKAKGVDLHDSLEITTSDDGILISLTDGKTFEMFRKGSAEPTAKAVILVEAIAEALRDRAGSVIIRGHTDARPFRSRHYDNWQLSTARAHFARYMLMRGGLDEDRIRRVEGVADREPRNKQDPQAPENRRIEIFLSRDVR